MKKKFIVSIVLLLILSGCYDFRRQAKDPNSNLNKTVDNIDNAANFAKENAHVAGPYGWIVGIVATAITASIGTYKSYRKNITIDEEKTKYSNIEVASKAVVDVIEDLSKIALPDDKFPESSIGELVKNRVEAKLKDKDIYKIGKAVIAGLKRS